MQRRGTVIALALALGALAAPASQAHSRQPGASRHHAVVARHRLATIASSNAFANLGHEGSGLLGSSRGFNAFANLGHEGSGLLGSAPGFNAFANLGHEGNGL
jgi:hypothetical protein